MNYIVNNDPQMKTQDTEDGYSVFDKWKTQDTEDGYSVFDKWKNSKLIMKPCYFTQFDFFFNLCIISEMKS